MPRSSTQLSRSAPCLGVLTGDVIGSSRAPSRHRQQMVRLLDRTLSSREIRRLPGKVKLLGHQIFRGDSFQIVLAPPDAALRAALHLMCRLKVSGADLGIPDGARVAIGIGPADYVGVQAGRRSETQEWLGDGAAFRASGQLLDQMKAHHRRIAVATPWQPVDRELSVACRFLDFLVDQWSPSQALAVDGVLLGRTQEAIAVAEKITQSAVAQRLRRANAGAIKALLKRYAELLQLHISPDANT